MATKYESKWDIKYLTNSEIYAAIRYLEPEPTGTDGQDDNTDFVVGISLVILLLACLALAFLFR